MTKFADKKKAIQLRKNGMSYRQIKSKLCVAKSTLSYWLREMPLSKKRISELRDKNEIRIEKFRNTMKAKKERRLKKIYDSQKKYIFPINKKEMFLAGLFLYWGEGAKTQIANLRISNTDPAILKFFIRWVDICLNVPKSKLKVNLQLYQDMDVNIETKFWVNKLNIPKKQFNKPYIKKSSQTNINHNKGGFGHGTCIIRLGNARLTEKIIMSLKTIADQYN